MGTAGLPIEPRVRRHPMRYQLVAYAESLVDHRAPVSAFLAVHVTACPRCSAEVRQIRASFEFTAMAGLLEPSQDLTAQILMRARHERQENAAHRRSPWWTACQSVVYGAALVAIAVLVFGMALRVSTAPRLQPLLLADSPAADTLAPSAETLRKTASEIQALSAAVRFSANKPVSASEREHRRAVSAMDADISAAQNALKRNPGCVRATHVVNANLQRQAETLRRLYVERAL
jgi:hypothetical protein